MALPASTSTDPRFHMTLTVAGRAKIAVVLADGRTITLARMALGDGGGMIVAPDENQTALVREVWHGALNSVAVDPQNPSQILVEAVVPSDVGGWTVREVGIFDADGLMVAVGSFAENYKPVSTEGSTREMIIQVYLAVASTAAISILVNNNIAVATRNYVDQRTTRAFIIPGGNAGNVLAKRSNTDGDTVWVDIGNGVSVTVDAREERQTLAAGQTIINLAATVTIGAAVYINGLRKLRGVEWTATTDTRITLATAATAGQTIVIVNNEAASPLSFLQKDKNLADVPDKAAARAALGFDAATVDLVYPVGSLYFSTVSTSPATLFKRGTWERYAEGRTIIGQKSSDAAFATSGQTGGAASVALTIAQLPPHSFTVPSYTVSSDAAGGHSHSIAAQSVTTSKDGIHVHNLYMCSGSETGGDVEGFYAGGATGNSHNMHCAVPAQGSRDWVKTYNNRNAQGNEIVQHDGEHEHTVTIPAATSSTVAAHAHNITIPAKVTNTVGSGAAVPTLPPYIVTYIWRRTA